MISNRALGDMKARVEAVEYTTTLPKNYKIKSYGKIYSRCDICGMTKELEPHHIIFGGNRRKWSDYYGLVAWICRRCHEQPHGKSKAQKGNTREELSAQAQKVFEEVHGHEKYMKIFGRNYRG